MIHVQPLESRRMLSAGDLDTTFGDGRLVVHPIDGSPHIAHALLVAGDKVLLVGDASDDQSKYLLERFNADGSTDDSFAGGDGAATVAFDSATKFVDQVQVDTDGKIIVSAQVNEGEDAVPVTTYIARFNADGSPDTSFGGGDGFFTTITPTFVIAFHAQDDGKIILADDDNVRRFNTDGSLDGTFGGGDGTAPMPLAGDDGGIVVVRTLDDGSILLGGAEGFTTGAGKFAVTKLHADGSIDTSFGASGIVAFDSIPNNPDPFYTVSDIVPLSGGKLLLSGSVGGFGGAVRLLADGSIDTTFGDHGGIKVLGGQSSPLDAIVDDAGRIYLNGLSDVARLTPDGQPDPTFGHVYGAGGASSERHDVGFQGTVAGITSNGRLIIAGARGFPADTHDLVILARLTEDDGKTPPIHIDNRVLIVPGTPGDDYIHAEDFNNALTADVDGLGRAFNLSDVDRISVTGGAGGDLLWMDDVHHTPCIVKGGDGRDTILGSNVNDTLEGNAQADLITGGLGADLIIGNGGEDHLYGNGGSDHIYGGAGDDILNGNGRNDRLVGGAGADEMHGGGGNDTFIADDGEMDHLFGGAGSDTAIADAGDVLLDIEST